MKANKILHYDRPTELWQEGLPLGNGRLAAMLLGANRGRLALNHEKLYRGIYRDRQSNIVSEADRHAVRRLLLDGKYEEGTRLGNRLYASSFDENGNKLHRVDPYQPAGDFYFSCDGEIREYRRSLDLTTATAEVSFLADGNPVSLTCFISQGGKGLIWLRLCSKNPMTWSFSLDRRADSGCVIAKTATEKMLSLEGQFEGDSRFCVLASLRSTNGQVSVREGNLYVENGTETVVVLSIGVGDSSLAPCIEAEEIDQYSFSEMLSLHRELWQKRYDGCDVTLMLEDPWAEETTDRRVEAYRSGDAPSLLPILYFNYGRYLLLSSSGELPANLQGKWNEDMTPPWDSDYHLDINLQMCYWPAELVGLSSTLDSVFSLCEKKLASGKETAMRLYGCRGAFLPLATDASDRATPEDDGWAAWIGGAAWMAQFYYLRWQFGRDKRFLAERAYPFFREVASFYEDYLKQDAEGVFQIVPSQSPENRFDGSGDAPVSLCVSSTMDLLLCEGVLRYAIEAAELLTLDGERVTAWKTLLRSLAKPTLSADGCLREWNEDFREREPGHRHFSPMVGCYPVDLTNEIETPELFHGAKRLLERRLSFGGGHTGWSRAWTACLYARFGEGNKAEEHLRALICDFATSSLLDLHPPRIFQIDGNLGGTAAIASMLLGSENGVIRLLPALPDCWRDGEATGLCARNGFTLSFVWKNGTPISATVFSAVGGECRILRNGVKSIRCSDTDEKVKFRWEGDVLCFDTQAGCNYDLSL